MRGPARPHAFHVDVRFDLQLDAAIAFFQVAVHLFQQLLGAVRDAHRHTAFDAFTLAFQERRQRRAGSTQLRIEQASISVALAMGFPRTKANTLARS